MIKRLVAVLVTILISLNMVGCEGKDYTSDGELLDLTFTYDGEDRSYLLYLPEGYYKDAPLVFVFHGYTSSASSIEAYTDFKTLADADDFVVCYPQGLEDEMGVNHWNANLTISDVDDIGFIEALAAELVDEYGLDSDRVFTCGMSNGGFISYTLAIHANDTFRAMASVTGIMSGYEWEHRDEATPIPVLQIHGTADPVVLPDGSMTTFGGWGGAPSVPEIVEFWSEINECQTLDISQPYEDVTANKYTDGFEDYEVWYYEVEGMGHEWPIEGVNTDFNATEVIWSFFSRYE